MAPKRCWAKANGSHSVSEDGSGFVQPSYGVTAVVFEQGTNLVPFGGGTMHLHDNSGCWSDRTSRQCCFLSSEFFLNNLPQ